MLRLAGTSLTDPKDYDSASGSGISVAGLDPFCTAGVTDGGASVKSCCPKSCGICGGRGCAERPGGQEDCCVGSDWGPCENPSDTKCIEPAYYHGSNPSNWKCTLVHIEPETLRHRPFEPKSLARAPPARSGLLASCRAACSLTRCLQFG